MAERRWESTMGENMKLIQVGNEDTQTKPTPMVYRERAGWFYGWKFSEHFRDNGGNELFVGEGPFKSYPETIMEARQAGYEVNNLGWKHRLVSANWYNHTIDGYPGWELVPGSKDPAFVKLSHPTDDPTHDPQGLCNKWDDIATVDFYKRDWTEDGIPLLRKGETYWSGWWFETIAERDQFIAWVMQQPGGHQVVWIDAKEVGQ